MSCVRFFFFVCFVISSYFSSECSLYAVQLLPVFRKLCSLHGCDRSNLSRRPMLISDPSLPGSSVEQKFLNSESSKHERCLPKLGDTVEGLSSTLENGVASSSGLPAASRGKGKAVSRMSKLKKKYWCFMPF
uniref:Secreted protein n=1 Tax=Nelumbo nucifera TaxID=4432 RepID=A0A822ZAF8_NELNU|nr:TPA_asm: hypothetical protein HUJ06_014964 [Nelumbo nucifera]